MYWWGVPDGKTVALPSSTTVGRRAQRRELDSCRGHTSVSAISLRLLNEVVNKDDK